MKASCCGLVVLALAGCGPAGAPADVKVTDTKQAACATGSPLPITGLCSDGNAALFLATDAGRDLFGKRCVWRTQEITTKPDEALVFRAQNCTGEGWDQQAYSFVSGYLKVRLGAAQDGDAFALQVFALKQGQTAEDAALDTLALAPEDQRMRCVTKPLPGIKVAGRAFELAPNAELKAEMEAANPDEPWDACGPNGVTMDAVQFWEGRDKRALFHTTGQDETQWDPASFTFYRQDADGKWAKDG